MSTTTTLLDHEKLQEDIYKARAESEKLRAESLKLQAEREKYFTEMAKYQVETLKLSRERWWFPFAMLMAATTAAAALMGAGVGLAKLL